MKQKILIAALMAGMLILAGCGGGSSGISEADVQAREEQAVKDALAGRTACEGDGVMVDNDGKCVPDNDHVSDADKAKAMAALGKAMYAALAGTSDTNDARANIVQPDINGDGELVINAAGNAGAHGEAPAVQPADPHGSSVNLKAGAAVGPLGSWKGMDYARSTGTGSDMKVVDEARVYTNQGPDTSVEFSKVGGDLHTLEATGANEGRVVIDTIEERALVMADAFLHSGTQTHPLENNRVYISVRGTYDGAPGEFQCTPTDTCSSTNDNKGSPSGLAGGAWTFKPDAGATVSRPDANYLYFGWWVHKGGDDGDPTAASAFRGRVGVANSIASPADITGSATYAGHAAGKFALNSLADGTGDGGHFTADAALTATFGAAGTGQNGLKGTIDNFRLNDGSEDPEWSVELNLSSTWAADSVTGGTTVWSVNGNKADASGGWNGIMYDEAPGDADADPPGDGSNIPTTVTGTFYSEFGESGRMVGAFGAGRQ